MSDCIFCKISDGEIPYEGLYEDDFAIAFLDINPLAPGHTVVIPRAHGETILDLSDETNAKLAVAVKQAVGMIDQALQPDGFTIGLNHKVGQAVPHVHVHIIPRWADDKGGNIHSIVSNKPEQELSQIAKKIRNSGE